MACELQHYRLEKCHHRVNLIATASGRQESQHQDKQGKKILQPKADDQLDLGKRRRISGPGDGLPALASRVGWSKSGGNAELRYRRE